MKKTEKKEITCRMAGVRDISTGRFYSAEEIRSDAKLKAEIERKMNKNVNRAFGLM